MSPSSRYTYDKWGLAPDFDFDAYKKAVEDELKAGIALDPTKEANRPIVAAITGLLLLDGNTTAGTAGFARAVRETVNEVQETIRDINGTPNKVTVLITKVDKAIEKIDGDSTPTISVQKLGYVSRSLAHNASLLPFSDPGFVNQVRLVVDEYVEEGGGIGLDLPPLSGESQEETEIEPANVRAVALVFAAQQYEEMRLFDVVDRLTDIFMNGMLPVGFDAAGKALDDYYWSSEDRLNPAARRMQYARMLGAPGGDVASEVAPNTEFPMLWLRFLASVKEYNRQNQISELFDRTPPRSPGAALSGEQVRKAGRDLAANLSLRGWASAHFAARRLRNHIRLAQSVLRLPEIQNVYGAFSPAQVIERVCQQEFGSAPNIVRYRTLAESGHAIFELLAKYSKVWTRSGTPLFEPRNSTGGGSMMVGGGGTADIPPADEAELLRHVEYILAVSGITDEEVEREAAASASVTAPSLPALGTGGGSESDGTIDQLRQIIEAGRTPTLQELQGMVGTAGVGGNGREGR